MNFNFCQVIIHCCGPIGLCYWSYIRESEMRPSVWQQRLDPSLIINCTVIPNTDANWQKHTCKRSKNTWVMYKVLQWSSPDIITVKMLQFQRFLSRLCRKEYLQALMIWGKVSHMSKLVKLWEFQFEIRTCFGQSK